MFLNKKVIIFSIFLVIAFSLCGCAKSNNNEANGKIKVVVSFNPIADFAKAVGGDKVDIYTVIPNGTEPHDFEIKAQDLKEISKAKIFIYNGLGMEPWVDKSISSIKNKDLIMVTASDNCELIKNIDADTVKEHGEYDPHTWLSLKNAKIEALNIKNALIKADPENKEYYEGNYSKFTASADSLYYEYKSKFDLINNKNFVTGHAAFGYLCSDFGLTQGSVENVFAEGEPTPKKLQELVDYCKKYKVKTIFVEELASPKVSQTLANEVNGNVKKIYTLESEEDNKSYLDSMRDNLAEIYDSLK